MFGMFCKCPAWDTVNQTKFADANANSCPIND